MITLLSFECPHCGKVGTVDLHDNRRVMGNITFQSNLMDAGLYCKLNALEMHLTEDGYDAQCDRCHEPIVFHVYPVMGYGMKGEV